MEFCEVSNGGMLICLTSRAISLPLWSGKRVVNFSAQKPLVLINIDMNHDCVLPRIARRNVSDDALVSIIKTIKRKANAIFTQNFINLFLRVALL